MSDVTDLKAEVLMLRRENKELRADRAHWELGNCPNCPNIADLQEALEQNAKLRELVRELWEGYNDPRCEECQLKDTPTCADCPICAREALVIDRMRELGIEVR